MHRGAPFALALAGLAAAALGAFQARAVESDLGTPRDLHGAEFAGSGACARCHPDHHASWSATHHRRMTQEANDTSVLAPFDGSELAYGGVIARTERDDAGRFVVRFRDQASGRELDDVEVERTVGSRRHQQFLARQDDVFVRLPIAWNVEEERLFHVNEAFLTPDPDGFGARRIDDARYWQHATRWNDNCVFCHNVGPNPGIDAEGAFDTKVAELGVACEACHGPGAEHVARNASPARRYALHGGDAPDPTIVSPSRLSPSQRADLCGRCHGQRITDDVGAFLAHGDPFVPGDDLALYSSPLWIDTTLGEQERTFEPRFWGDGTARLTAYEYQGLVQSRCTSEGELTCTDCHAMHDGDPRGQLRPDRPGDALCAGACHVELASREAARAHAHHDDVACVDCHQPRIVYGIRAAHRSHRIDVPRPAANARAHRPDACTLCHVDRGTSWAEAALAAWRGAATASNDDEEEPAMLAHGVGGDPIERAVLASALSWAHAPRAARLGLALATMEGDPYPAVRAIAWQSVRGMIPELDVNRFRATDGPAERAMAVATVRASIDEPALAPDASRIAELRARASTVAIEIGE